MLPVTQFFYLRLAMDLDMASRLLLEICTEKYIAGNCLGFAVLWAVYDTEPLV